MKGSKFETRAENATAILEGTLYGPKDPDNPTAAFPAAHGDWCWQIPLPEADRAKLEFSGLSLKAMVERAAAALGYLGFRGHAHMATEDWRGTYGTLIVRDDGHDLEMNAPMTGALRKKGKLGDEAGRAVMDRMMREMVVAHPEELARRIRTVVSHSPAFFSSVVPSAQLEADRDEFAQELADFLGVNDPHERSKTQ